MPTITQRIALSGDAEIKAAFDALGAAGSAAFQKIQNAANAAKSIQGLAPTLADLKTRVEAVGEAGRNFGENFNKVSDSLLATVKSIALIGGAIGGAIVGFGFLVKGAGDAAHELDLAAQVAGTTAQNFQNLQGAASLFGIGSDQLSTALRGLNRSMEETQIAAANTQKAQNALSKEYLAGKITATDYVQKQQDLNEAAAQNVTVYSQLNIATRNADGTLRDTTAVLLDLANAFHNMPDGADKSGEAMKALGRSGAQMVPFLNLGEEGIKALINQINGLAPPITAAQIAIGEKLSVAFSVLDIAASRAKESILLAFAPATSALVTALTNFISANRASWEALATQIAAKVVPVIDSVVARLQTLSSDVNTDFVVKLADNFIAFGQDAVAAIGIVITAWNGFVAILQTVADGINAVFGTQITGQTLALVAVLGVVTGAFSAIAAVIGLIISTVGLLDAALVLVFGPAGAALAGMALLAAAIGALIVQIPQVQAAFDALISGFTGTVNNFKTLFAIIGAEWTLLWNDVSQVAQDALTKVMSFIQPIIDAITSVANTISGLTGGGGGQTSSTAPGLAGGGAVRGPGSTTSDSIWARLSDKEYVQRAAAVKTYGVDFMNALNSLSLSPRAVRALMDGMNLSGFGGGMAPRYAFASGGLAVSGGGGHTLNLALGGENFGPFMTNDDDLMNRITRWSVRQQVRSAGRKPTWQK